MRTVEAKLADWNRLYNELAQAQARLADPAKLPSSRRAELEAEVARLQRDCDSALDLRAIAAAEPRHAVRRAASRGPDARAVIPAAYNRRLR